MTLKPGSWLNHYEVLAHLGTGAHPSRAREQAVHQSRDCMPRLSRAKPREAKSRGKGATTQLGSIA